MEKFIHLQTKKAVSPIIAYVLLIGIGLALATITFQVLKTYVPVEQIECPASVSARIINSNCTLEGGKYKINLILQNNGLFKFSGLYAYYGKNIENKIAGENLGEHLIQTQDYTSMRGEGIFLNQELNPNQEVVIKFEIPQDKGETKMLLELTPFQIEIIDKKTQLAACSQARINQIINCN